MIEALWPGSAVDAAAPRLHKAAHYARRALGGEPTRSCCATTSSCCCPDARRGRRRRPSSVALGERGARRTARSTPPNGALTLYGGELLPEDLYEPWADGAPRTSLRPLHLDLLRLAGRWEELLAEEPADEEAHLAAGAGHATGATCGRRCASSSGWSRPCAASWAPRRARRPRQLRATGSTRRRPRPRSPRRRAQRRPAGRRRADRRPPSRDAARARDAGRGGGPLVLAGAPGWASPALLDLAVALARQRGWRTGRGSASAVEGPWPYAPVLEALGDLCRQHPALLDGLDDALPRGDRPRAVRRSVTWTGESGHQRLFVAAAELVRLAAAGHGLLLVVDDVHEADEASLRLLHYLARCAATSRCWSLLAHRPAADEARADRSLASLVGPDAAPGSSVPPLVGAARPDGSSARCRPSSTGQPVDQIWEVSGGAAVHRARAGAARRRPERGGEVAGAAGRRARAPSQRVALLGHDRSPPTSSWPWSGVGEDEAYHHLEVALAALVVEPAEAGYRFRHPLVREALLRHDAAARRGARRAARSPERLADLGAPPGRVAHQYLAAGLPRGRCRTSSGRSRPRGRWAPTGTPWPWSTRSGSTPGPRSCRGCWPGAATC